MNETELESYICNYKNKINERIRQCGIAPPIISRPPSCNSIIIII